MLRTLGIVRGSRFSFAAAAIAPVLIGVLLPIPAWAQQKLTFVDKTNPIVANAAWRVAPQDVSVLTGGHPDVHLRTSVVDGSPTLRTQPRNPLDAPYWGPYRYIAVVGVGVDVKVFSTEHSVQNRPVSLVLHSEMDTPVDPSDDCDAILVGSKHVPREGSGWKTFDFKVPALSDQLPPGWVLHGTCGGLTQDQAWVKIVTWVDEARWVLGDATQSYDPQLWDVGFDNGRVTIGKGGVSPQFQADIP